MDTTQFHSRLDYSHTEQEIFFCLCVDHFVIKYFGKDDADHLLGYPRKHYKVSTNWEGPNHLGFQRDWN